MTGLPSSSWGTSTYACLNEPAIRVVRATMPPLSLPPAPPGRHSRKASVLPERETSRSAGEDATLRTLSSAAAASCCRRASFTTPASQAPCRQMQVAAVAMAVVGREHREAA